MVEGIGTLVSDAFPIAFSMPGLAIIALIILAMTKVGRILQRSLEWGHRQQQGVFGRLAAIGTDAEVIEEFGRRSHRVSIGVRAMLALTSVVVLTTYPTIPVHEFPAFLQDHTQAVFILLAVVLLYSNIQIWTFEVSTEGGIITIPTWCLTVRDHLLSDLVSVEKRGAAQVLLRFADGSRARIITHVAGSRDLLNGLQDAVDNNARG